MTKPSRSSKRVPNCVAKQLTKRVGIISPPRKACAFAPVSWRGGWWTASGATTRIRSCWRRLYNPSGSLALPSFCVVGGLTPRETLQIGHPSFPIVCRCFAHDALHYQGHELRMPLHASFSISCPGDVPAVGNSLDCSAVRLHRYSTGCLDHYRPPTPPPGK